MSLTSNHQILTSLHGRKAGLSRAGHLVVAGRRAIEVNDSGAIFSVQVAPVAVNATATLTAANLLTGLITSTTAAAVTATLPTGTLMDAAETMAVNDSFTWTVINTGAANALTVAAGTAHTVVGNMVVALSTSATFLTRKTAANTFVTYRAA